VVIYQQQGQECVFTDELYQPRYNQKSGSFAGDDVLKTQQFRCDWTVYSARINYR